MMRTTLYSILVVLVVLFTGQQLLAQEKIEKRVQVIRAYRPEVKEAYKISELPEITDTTQTAAEFNYYILPKRLETKFEVEPIPAATMVSEPLSELYSSYVKLGMGSKFSPTGALYITNKRSKEWAFGAFFRHHSSTGKVPLPGEGRVFAGYGHNQVELFGKQFFEHSVLNADVGFVNDRRYFYGYNTSIDTTLLKDDIKQNLKNLSLNIGYKSTYIDSSHLNYDLRVEADHLNDNYNTTEGILGFTGKFDKYFDGNHAGVISGYNYLNHRSPRDTVSDHLFQINPWIAKYGDGWRIQGGVNFFTDVTDGNAKARIYPTVRMEYDMVSQYFIPYGGVDGKLSLNSYSRITSENPFVMPGLHVENTNYNMILFAGIKGNFGPSTLYNVKASYTFFDNMHFFVNEIASTDSAANQFDVVYGNGELLNLFGELSFDLSESLNLRLEGNYYGYTLYNQFKPWHKPGFDFSLSAQYNLRDKILVGADLFMKGKRWVMPPGKYADPMELAGYADFNISLEYRYSKVLSGYLEFKNLLADNYSLWNNYPVYGLQVYLGVTYAF